METSKESPLLKTSSARQKRRGDNGSPCLTPQGQAKYPSCFPLIEIESFVE